MGGRLKERQSDKANAYRFQLTPSTVDGLAWLRDAQYTLIVERRRQRGHGTRANRCSYQNLFQWLNDYAARRLEREAARLNITLPPRNAAKKKRTSTAPPKSSVDTRS